MGECGRVRGATLWFEPAFSRVEAAISLFREGIQPSLYSQTYVSLIGAGVALLG